MHGHDSTSAHPSVPSPSLTTDVLEAIKAMRKAAPLVQCLTNAVVSNITANALLAAGAAPAMCDTPDESFDFAQLASGVLINGGTPNPEQYEGMRQAIAGARQAGTPWVLDPVAAGALTTRTNFYREVLPLSPAVIRGNASEIGVLGGASAGGRGVDATDRPEDVLAPARHLSSSTGATVAISGATDYVVTGERITAVKGGHPTMAQVIGTGCFLGALVAAYAGAAKAQGLDLHAAVVAAHAHTKAAGVVAGQLHPTRPGSFAVAWLDALAELTPEQILELVTLHPAGKDGQA
ncbi:hydroxyethylthiazole kinase [Rothia nasimurium]|uniref:hydroxyethylthiazole kinase n=1 Tax=Rothia nasimurium TaxID=85336 RepID=UPI003B9DE12D